MTTAALIISVVIVWTMAACLLGEAIGKWIAGQDWDNWW